MSLFLKKPIGVGSNNIQGGPTNIDTWYVPVVSGAGYNSDVVAYTVATPFTGIGAAMAKGKLYAFQATTDCWIRQSANATTNAAAKAASSMFVLKGMVVMLDGAQGAQLSVIQDLAGGNASIVEVTA